MIRPSITLSILSLVLFLALTADRQGFSGTLQSPLAKPDAEDRAEPTPSTIEEIEQLLFRRINSVRAEYGLQVLQNSPQLAAVARRHSQDMLARKYFSHRSPGGAACADRLRAAGFDRLTASGENLARVHGFLNTVRTAVEEWMNSPEHRQNIIRPSFRRSGVGAAISEDGTVFLTQVFISP